MYLYSTFQVNDLLLVTNGGVISMTNGILQANPLNIDIGGLLNADNETIAGNVVVENGGWLKSIASVVKGSLTVTNQGVVNANGVAVVGPTTVANGGLLTAVNVDVSSLTVGHGGVLDVLDAPYPYVIALGLNGPVNNSGLINLTNGTIVLVNNVYDGGAGGLVNQAGGLINLQGSGSIISDIGLPGYEQLFHGYVINQGTITQIAGTNSISCPFYDNSQGTITNLSGVLSLGLFQTNLAGIYFAAAGATIQFVGANIANDNAAPQLTLGTPLVLAG